MSSDATYDYAFIDSRTNEVVDAGSHKCSDAPA